MKGDEYSVEDLLTQFHVWGRILVNGETQCNNGIFVSSKVRKEILLGDHQGKTIMNGCVREIGFKNQGGGIWRAFLVPEQPK